jgi:KTSC domain
MPEMRPVESSWVAAIGYEENAREVHVALLDGAAYAFESVPPEVWRLFLTAESKGTFVNEVLKPGYEVRKLSSD